MLVNMKAIMCGAPFATEESGNKYAPPHFLNPLNFCSRDSICDYDLEDMILLRSLALRALRLNPSGEGNKVPSVLQAPGLGKGEES